MENKISDIDQSILSRCNQKYYDKALAKYDISYTQMYLLLNIYENEGVSMYELANDGAYDKGTVTKAIQKLEQLEYVSLSASDNDRRIKLLYTTSKGDEIIPSLYITRQKWQEYLFKDVSKEDFDIYHGVLDKLNQRARNYLNYEESNSVKIYGLQKLTLLDYPGKMAATLFTGGCNFRCPFCHNRSLVFLNEQEGEIDKDIIFDYLNKRSKVLDGVCISGGEPLLQDGIKDFIRQIKDIGLLVKLDSNGSNYELLKELIDEKLVDYVAMDIKNSRDKYSVTCGLNEIDLGEIEKSVSYLKKDLVDYEFRTTIVKEFHEDSNFDDLGKWLKGSKRYFLQNFEDRDTCIRAGLHPMAVDDLKLIRDKLSMYIDCVTIRGIENV